MRWAEHVSYTWNRRGAYRVLVGKHEGKRSLEDLGIDGRIIVKWTFKKWDGETWTGFIYFGYGHKPSGSIKCGEFLG
jgi:hypothetical protein